MKFGNWEVTDKGVFGLNAMKRYEIIREDLQLLINDEYIDKLIHISEKDGMSKEEIFNLNMAYIYALGKFGIVKVTEVHMQNTTKKQLEIIG